MLGEIGISHGKIVTNQSETDTRQRIVIGSYHMVPPIESPAPAHAETIYTNDGEVSFRLVIAFQII